MQERWKAKDTAVFSENLPEKQQQDHSIQEHDCYRPVHRLVFLHIVGDGKYQHSHNQHRQNVPDLELFFQCRKKGTVAYSQQHKGEQERKTIWGAYSGSESRARCSSARCSYS